MKTYQILKNSSSLIRDAQVFPHQAEELYQHLAQVLSRVNDRIVGRRIRPPYFNSMNLGFDELFLELMTKYQEFYKEISDLYAEETGKILRTEKQAKVISSRKLIVQNSV